MKVLRIVNSITHTSAPYHQFTLPVVDSQDITICAYFDSVIQPHPSLKYISGEGRLGKFLKNLKCLLQEEYFDVVHVHHVQVGFLFVIVNLLFNTGSSQRSILTFHTSYHLLTFRQRLLLILCFVFFRKIVACSQSSFDSIPSLLKYMSNSRLAYIMNGFNIDMINNAIKHFKPKKAEKSLFVVLYVASLNPGKNHLAVLQAFRKWNCPSAVLKLVGGGSLLKDLEKAAQALGCRENVIFTGIQPRDIALEAMLSADLFISPSEGEGMPIAVLEAMACGCPMILSDIPPHRELVKNIDCIPLLKPNDVEGFARAMNSFAAMPEKQIKEIKHRVRSHVVEYYSIKNMLDNYLQVYEEISDSH